MIKTTDPNDSVIIKPRRVYACKPCKWMGLRNHVGKVIRERRVFYYHEECGGEVEDITNKITGNDFMEILGV